MTFNPWAFVDNLSYMGPRHAGYLRGDRRDYSRHHAAQQPDQQEDK